MELSLTILLTGFAVVFAVLLVLIGVIKLYGTIIYRLQNKKRGSVKKDKVVVERPQTPVVTQPLPADDDADYEQDDAVIAVIAAAVYTVYSPQQVRIRSIRRESRASGAWRAAGLRDNTAVF